MRAYRLAQADGYILGFAGSHGDAVKNRMAQMEKHALKRSEIEIKEIDIPTDKTNLLTFLNELVAS